MKSNRPFAHAANAALTSILLFAACCAQAAPTLITPTLPPAHMGQAYSAGLILASSSTISNVTVTGLPEGLSATHNGSGGITISGTPTATGSFSVAIAATDANGTLNASAPLAVFGNGATSVSARGFHACAVVNGGVQCWGENNYGQLGIGSTAVISVPVLTIAAGSGVTAVATGGNHACAVVNGGVRCWGNNDVGQLGNNGNVNSLLPVQTIAASSGATAVAVGYNHTCAVVTGGVRCWGGNASGQLGNNSTTDSPVPVEAMPPNSGVTALVAGQRYTCALLDGGVKCWGENSSGELGVGSTTSSPVPVQAIAPGSGVTALAAGSSHNCAVVNGGVRCWGYNQYSQLGNDNNNNSPVPVQTVAEGSGVTKVAAGTYHSCLLKDGRMWCWGNNQNGQLGTGDQISVGGVNLAGMEYAVEGTGMIDLAAGHWHSCAVLNGGVRCWGRNDSGALGNNHPLRSLVPVQALPPASAIDAVATGSDQACVAINGGVQCWGGNAESGQLGNNSKKDSPVPVQTIAAASGVASVVAGSNHYCAIANGGLLCWGANESGQLGSDSMPDSTAPFQTLAAGIGVTAAAGGSSHTCVVINGGVLCWGWNALGQLGNGNTANSASPQQAIAPGSGATAVSAGHSHTCAVVNGGVQCWGHNPDGRLGNGNTTASTVPVQAIAPGSGVTTVVAGEQHTCALVNGGVRCWGLNSEGQLGNNSTTNSSVPVQAIAANSGVTAIDMGAYHSCAVINGGVQCWGDNFGGQLGDNSSIDRRTPVQAIAAGNGVTAVAAGDAFTCAVVNAGLACWGSNLRGQLTDPERNFTQPALRPRKAMLVPTSGPAPAPAFGTSATNLTFTVQTVGTTSAAQTLTITNIGLADLTLGTPTVTGPFALASNNCATVVPDSTCTMTITFTPIVSGAATGQISIPGNAAGSPHLVALNGTAINRPVLDISLPATVVAGGNLRLGLILRVPAGQPAIVGAGVNMTYPPGFSNRAGGVLQAGCISTLAGTSVIGGNTLGASNGSLSPPASGTASCSLGLADLVAPSTPGTYTFSIAAGAFTTLSPAYVNTAPITRTINVLPAGFGVTPTVYDFSDVLINTTSPVLTATISNSTAAPVTLTSLGITGNFGFTSTCPQPPATLSNTAGNNTCTLGITFTPQSVGYLTGNLTIVNDAGPTQVISLSGNGIVQVVQLTPPAINFTTQAVGTTSAAQTLTITNNGQASLVLGVPTLSGPFAITGNTCASVAPSGNCTVAVTFSPSANGAAAGQLSIPSNAPNSPHVIALNGVGVNASLAGVFSRKTHGAAVHELEIDRSRSINEAITVEPRTSGRGHTIVFKFVNAVTAEGTATALDANMVPVGAVTLARAGNDVIATLANVPDNQRLTLRLTGVNGGIDVEASIGFLVGDVGNTKRATAADIAAIKANLNVAVDSPARAKFDINADGAINAADLTAVKARAGIAMP
jgi:alpha-tubulin suppressor-like RCC1 family protein